MAEPITLKLKTGTLELEPNRSLNGGTFGGMKRVAAKMGGASDICASIGRTANFVHNLAKAGVAIPDEVKNWTLKVNTNMGLTRTCLAVPNMLVSGEKLSKSAREAAKSGASMTLYRDLGEMAATTGFAVEAMIADPALSQRVAAAAIVLKNGVDAYDLCASAKELVDVSKIACENQEISEEGRTALQDKQTVLGYKIAKLALSIFAGIGLIAMLVFGVVLNPVLSVTMIAAGAASAFFSLMVDYRAEMSPYAAKIQA